jgi:hypothetical protein
MLPNILAVKENQPTLYGNIRDFFDGIHAIPEDGWQSAREKDHGRLEKREVRIVTNVDWMPDAETLRVSADSWKDLKTIAPCCTTTSSTGLSSQSKRRRPDAHT